MNCNPVSTRKLPLTGVALALAALAAPVADTLAAEIGPVTVGAGLRTGFASTDTGGSGSSTEDFFVDSARIYISGKVTESIGFMFNTEYQSSDSDIEVIDAVAQYSASDQFNIWAGRFLAPSDRANLYGPYYASNWGVYKDGVQDGYPFITTGRSDGLMYWGQFGMAKVSAGAFDNTTPGGSDELLYAGRLQLDFWDPEAGYYLNGTYYGEKDLLALGVAAQTSDGDTAFSVDALLEKKLPNLGVITLEAQYADYDGLGGYGVAAKSSGYYGLAAYLFPAPVGPGRFQILAKYGTATHEAAGGDIDWDTLEVNLNYIIKAHNARIHLFYIDRDSDTDAQDLEQFGIGLQIQM